MSMLSFFTNVFSNPTNDPLGSNVPTRHKSEYVKKESISSKPDFLKSTKAKDIYESNPWADMEEDEPVHRQINHRSRKETSSTSTATSLLSPLSPSRNGHKQTKSLAKQNKVDILSLHDGEKELLKTDETPLLFAKGGYEKHVEIKEVKQSHSPKKSISQLGKTKGGFMIIEKDDDDEMEDAFEPPVRFSSFKEVDTSNFFFRMDEREQEVEDFLAGRLDFSPQKNRSAHKKDASLKENNEALFNTDFSNGQGRLSSMSHKRFASTTAKILNAENVKDPLLEGPKLPSIRAKLSFAPGMGDLSSKSTATHTTYERSYSCYNSSATPSNIDFYGYNNSKKESLSEKEDQTSQLDLDIDETNERNDFVSSLENNSFGEGTLVQDSPLFDKLIEEYKAIQAQKLYEKGIYLMPTSNPLVWNCLIAVGGGYYEKAKFKFQIEIPEEYPNGNLIVYSKTKIYHPLVNIETGEVDLKLFGNPSEDRIAKLALFIKSIFNESKYLEKNTSFNEEAGNRYVKNPYYFKIKARDSVKATNDNTLTEKTDISASVIESVRKLAKEKMSTKVKFEDKVNDLINSVKRSAMNSN